MEQDAEADLDFTFAEGKQPDGPDILIVPNSVLNDWAQRKFPILARVMTPPERIRHAKELIDGGYKSVPDKDGKL